MRFSRPCYDKPHWCPGHRGGGMMWAKRLRCEGGRTTKRLFGFRTCDECDVIIWPLAVRWLDWQHWRWWLRHRVSMVVDQRRWLREERWRRNHNRRNPE